MKLIKQPEGSSLCGQACVAMLAGVSLEKSVSVFGKRGGTTTKEVIAALKKLGVKCGNKLFLAKNHIMTPICIAKLHFSWDKSHTHWTIYHNGVFYDPAIGKTERYPEGVRVTSFLPVYMEGSANE